MARQQIIFDSAQKQFEDYLDFSGGLNSEISNERLRENEFPVFENVDLSSRASAKKRNGKTLIFSGLINPQGAFYYYRVGNSSPDTLFAANGRLYLKPFDQSSYSEIIIKDGTNDFTFQTTTSVEAVQYKNILYIATGTKLVQVSYDATNTTWSANVVVPYQPTVQEVIFIGTNALADNPDSFIADGVGSLEVLGVVPSLRTGALDSVTTFTAYINKPTSGSVIDYKWEYKKTDDATFTLGKDFTAGANTFDFKPNAATTYDIQLTIRDEANTAVTTSFIVTEYQVTPTNQKSNTSLPYQGIQSCTRILLHWDRIILYGSTVDNPTFAWISDLGVPGYFPTFNTLNFTIGGKQEPLTDIVHYRNTLVAFTRSTCQTVLGTSPDPKSESPYKRFTIHDGIGCSVPGTARVVGNYILFRSDEGISRLKPNQYVQETMNVDRVDQQIKSEIPADAKAASAIFNNQYWLCFPDSQITYRYYYESGVWVKDTSTKQDCMKYLQFAGELFEFTARGTFNQHDPNVFADEGDAYDMTVESKFLDLASSFNNKKIRRLYVLGRHIPGFNNDLYVYVQADAAMVLTPESGEVQVDPETNMASWVATITPNFQFYNGTIFGAWLLGTSPWGDIELSVQRANVRGKCRRMKVKFVHKQPNPCEIYGFGVEYKFKRI